MPGSAVKRPQIGPALRTIEAVGMDWLTELHLFRLFELYLSLFFLVGIFLRFRQYHAFARLITAFPGRWPKLMQLVRQHRRIFLTWGTVLPLLTSAGLLLVQIGARKLVWPAADGYTVADLFSATLLLGAVSVFGLGMLAFDVYGALKVGEIDRPLLEKYFDLAEFWLKSPAARVVHVVTFGYVNPRAMVATEVQTALLSASKLLNYSLWWVALQAGLRFAFGLSLWTAYLCGSAPQ